MFQLVTFDAGFLTGYVTLLTVGYTTESRAGTRGTAVRFLSTLEQAIGCERLIIDRIVSYGFEDNVREVDVTTVWAMVNEGGLFFLRRVVHVPQIVRPLHVRW